MNASGLTASAFNFDANTTIAISASGADETISITYQGTARTIDSATNLQFVYGTLAIGFAGNTQASITISAGDILTVTLGSAFGSAAISGKTLTAATGFYGIISAAGLTTASLTIGSVDADDTRFIIAGNAVQVNVVIADLDSALTTLRSNAQTLGSNVALLQTRLDFTNTYVDTLETGAAKLTLADINEEGANLLALQTRQQLGISALAFAGQAEQGILSLFR